MVVPNFHYQTVGYRYAHASHIVVHYELIVGHCLDEYITGTVGHSYQVEVTLENAILAWCAVYGDVAIIGTDAFALLVQEREVVFVNRGALLVFTNERLPFSCMHLYLIYIIALLVQERCYSCSAAHTYVMLGGITSANYCNNLFF